MRKHFMTRTSKHRLALYAAVATVWCAAVTPAFPQATAPAAAPEAAPAAKPLTNEELEQLVAPIALFPV
jgi:hypothetical protein